MGDDDSSPFLDSSSAPTAELEHASTRLSIASHMCCSNAFWFLAVVLTHREGSLRGLLSTLLCTAAVYNALCLLPTMLHCTALHWCSHLTALQGCTATLNWCTAINCRQLLLSALNTTMHCTVLHCTLLFSCAALQCTCLCAGRGRQVQG